MAKAVGIGGVFFRAKEPARLQAWYERHLGINRAPTDMEMPPWRTSEGVVVFAPFAEDTDYFPADKQFMLNFRVDDMDALLDRLRTEGIEPFNEQTMEGLGRFAHILDPEGNAVELWEPA